MNKILLEGMKFYAEHGYYTEEQKIGGEFSVDLTLETEFNDAAKDDDISGTVNYEEVYAVVKEEMATPVQLLEHAADKIVNRLIHEFKQITYVKIKLSKLNPPISGEVEKVSVIIER